jgi:hypothetical protein
MVDLKRRIERLETHETSDAIEVRVVWAEDPLPMDLEATIIRLKWEVPR